MKFSFTHIYLLTFLSLLLKGQHSFAQKIHSHNDYLQSKPFFTAFEAKADNIEVDVFFVNNKLLVAHSLQEIDSTKTLSSLYFDNLSIAEINYELNIMIDIKSEPISSLQAIIKLLESKPKLISNPKLHYVISGNRPAAIDYKQYPAFIKFDVQELQDLKINEKFKLAFASFSFSKFIKKDGSFKIIKIKKYIKLVHNQGLEIRFWAIPDNPSSWKTLHNLGVDIINTDNPTACKAAFQK